VRKRFYLERFAVSQTAKYNIIMEVFDMSTNLTSCEDKIKNITGGFKAGTLYRSILGLMHQGGNFKKTTHS
jgi:hypothetical protein